MLRETCPEEFTEVDVEPARTPPSALVIFGPPLLLCALAVLVAWLHTRLGSPFGEQWAAKLWAMVEMAITATVPALAFGAYVRRQNEHALRVLRARQEVAALSGASLPRVRQTGPHRSLSAPRRGPPVEPDVEDEGDDRW